MNVAKVLAIPHLVFFSFFLLEITLFSPNSSAESAVVSNQVTTTLLLDTYDTGSRIVAIGWRGHIVISDDRGQSWKQVIADTRFLLSAVTFASDKKGWAVGHNSTILHTNDGGLTWVKQYEDLTLMKALFDVWFLDENIGWAVGSLGLVMHTEDGGKSWQNISEALNNPDQYHYYGIAGNKQGTLYIVGERDATLEGGLIFQSTDTGKSWKQLGSASPGTLFGVSISPNQSTMYVYGILGNLYRSTNLGQSFEKIPLPTRETVTNLEFIDDNNIIAVGAKGLIATSENGIDFSNRFDRARNDFTSVLPLDQQKAIVTGPKGVSIIDIHSTEIHKP